MRAIAPLFVLVFLHSGCAVGPRTAPVSEKRSEQKPIPPECVDAVQRAARLGEVIFFEDKVAAWATDALFAQRILPGDKRVRGWVSTRRPGLLTTHFLGGGDAAGPYLELYKVEFRPRSGASPTTGTALSAADARVVRVDPPQPPSDQVARMFRARQTALGEPFRGCSDRYNSVVLPPEFTGESGWLVYLLAATTKAEVLFGGHIRRLVSPDGATVVKDEPLSKSCTSVPLPDPKAGNVSALFATSVVSACPLETHVFLSFLHGWPIMVANSGGTWGVKGREIRFYGPHERRSPADVTSHPSQGAPTPQ